MPRHHMINNEKVPFTAAEETARDAEEASWASGANNRAFAVLREKRDQLLNDTDWWVLRGSITEAQTAYRQTLRELPANTPDPPGVTWPVAPSKED